MPNKLISLYNTSKQDITLQSARAWESYYEFLLQKELRVASTARCLEYVDSLTRWKAVASAWVSTMSQKIYREQQVLPRIEWRYYRWSGKDAPAPPGFTADDDGTKPWEPTPPELQWFPTSQRLGTIDCRIGRPPKRADERSPPLSNEEILVAVLAPLPPEQRPPAFRPPAPRNF